MRRLAFVGTRRRCAVPSGASSRHGQEDGASPRDMISIGVRAFVSFSINAKRFLCVSLAVIVIGNAFIDVPAWWH
jgi:hypothetical protein